MMESQSQRCRNLPGSRRRLARQLRVRSDRSKGEDVTAGAAEGEREPGAFGDVCVCVGGTAAELTVGGEETGLCKGNE